MDVKIHSIKEIRKYMAGELKEIYMDQDLSALTNIIIKTVFGSIKLHQLYSDDLKVTASQSEKIFDICKELKTGKPLQYILGETLFYNCIIRLNNATLIPRHETEELVDLIIKENRIFKGNIIDFGAGSGCIAIALAANIPGAEVTGTDISEEALRMATENAHLNNVTVSFIRDDIFNPEKVVDKLVEILVSNPPYVRKSEKILMNKNVLEFEPHSALFVPDSDPLVYYKALLKIADKILITGGRLYFEINEAMGKPMIQLLVSYKYADIEIVADLNGKERIIKAKKNV